MRALLSRCGEEHLHRSLGEHGGADVAALHHVIARAADALLLLNERRAHGGRGRHGAHGAVDLGRADGIGHVDAADGNAARNRLALLVREGDVVGAREAAERFVVVEGNPVLQRPPGDGAVHRARVEAGEAQLAGDGLRDRGLAGPAGAVDGNDHRANLSISVRNCG